MYFVRDLETALKNLQEAVRKRNPDSIPALIQAAALTDSALDEKRMLEQTITDLKAELQVTQDEHKLKMRSLRQELERLKANTQTVLKQQLQHSNNNHEEKSNNITGSNNVTSNNSNNSTQFKTLAQASVRIKDLETELERTRAFYKKKLDENIKKYELQMRSLKRGNGHQAAVSDQDIDGEKGITDSNTDNKDVNQGIEATVVKEDVNTINIKTMEQKSTDNNNLVELRQALHASGVELHNALVQLKQVICERDAAIDQLSTIKVSPPSTNNVLTDTVSAASANLEVSNIKAQMELMEQQFKLKLEFAEREFKSYKDQQNAVNMFDESAAAQNRLALQNKENEVNNWREKYRQESMHVVQCQSEIGLLQSNINALTNELKQLKHQPLTPSLAQFAVSI